MDKLQYDEIDNRIADQKEDIDDIQWNVYGKISYIHKTTGVEIWYTYDAAGNRISKRVKDPNNGIENLTTWYVRDAEGNVLSVYIFNDPNIHNRHLTQTEVHLYGSSRLGMVQPEINVQTITYPEETYLPLLGSGYTFDFSRGKKLFELSNHLGNVLVTVSDKKMGVDQNADGTIDYYTADVITANDYYPFGMVMPERKYTASGTYRFGFQTQEKVNEIAGEGNHYTAQFWEYDSRLGRRWNQDPKPNPSISNYAAFANNPIFNIDILGDTTYRFNQSDGKYIGMYDLDAAGQQGSYGTMKTIGKGKNKQEVWDGQYFNFADPVNDSKDIANGTINQLIFVSDADIKGMLTAQGAFNYDDKNSFRSFYNNSTGGQNFDYSFTVIPQKYGAQGASATPLDPSTPSRVLFLPQGDYIAHNHMNFGNYLWAASGYTLGFNFATLQLAAHANSLINSKKNGYPAQWDSPDDQNSIKKGAFHALQFKYRTILEVRHQAQMQQQGGGNR